MTKLRLQNQGFNNQQLVLERLHDEAIQIHSVQANYIPRTMVAEDAVLGEDRLSEFRDSYPIDVYIENYGGYTGENSFASKFGLQIQSGATFVISRRGWGAAVARYGQVILPNRPAEGDLIYLPMTKGLFEVMYVDNKSPFYELGESYSYKLTVELFRYASEKIDTGEDAIDKFETKHTHDTTIRTDIDTLIRGADNNKFKDRASDLILDRNNPFGDV